MPAKTTTAQPLTTLLNSVASGIVISDNTAILFTNVAAQKLLGYGGAALLAMRLTDVIEADFRQALVPDTAMVEVKLATGDDVERWAALSIKTTQYDSKAVWLVTLADITRQKHHSDMMSEHENLYRMLVRNIPGSAVYLFDHDLRFKIAEGADLEKHGFSSELVEGRTLYEVVPPEGVTLMESIYLSALAGNEVTQEIVAGDTTWIIRAAPIKNDQGTIIAGVIGAYNITQQKKIEEALSASQRIYRAIAWHFPNGAVYLFDHAGRYMVADGQVLRELGFSHDQLVGKLLREVMPSTALLEQIEGMIGAAFEGRETTLEVAFQGRIHVMRSVPVRDEQGGIFAAMIVTQDITEHIQMEEALRESNRRYDELAANIPAMVYSLRVTPEHQMIFDYVSPRCRKINGIEAEDVLKDANAFHSLIHPDDWPAYEAECDKSGHLLKPFYWEGRLNVRGLWRWMRMESFPRRMDDASMVWEGIQIDITAQKLADAALQEQASLQVAFEKEHELNQLKDRMLERISHEFRTPLAIINTSAELLERYFERMNAEQRLEHLHKIRLQTQHVTEVLDDIRHLGREGLGRLAFNPTVIDLHRICENVVSAQEWLRAKRTVTCTPEGELHPIFADERLLRAILYNLISNAVKFSHEGQTIWLTAETHEADVILTVRDEGIGIDPDEIPHLFEPFFRGANTVNIGGLGLGLSIVKEAINLHHGTITVKSAPGQGTTVTLRLPQ